MPTFYKISGIPFEDYYIPKDLYTYGGLWTWGQNNLGQLGDNTLTNKSSPVQTVAGSITWKLIGNGPGSGQTSSAIKTDGTLWLWGYNNFGTLGDNTSTNNRSSPVQTVTFATNWKSISCGNSQTAAIKTDGTLWTWGDNTYGQLGDNTITNRSSPVQTVTFATNWKSVSSGSSVIGAIKTDGTLWLWGYNGNAQLGDNTGGVGTNKSSPVQTVAGGTNWKLVSCSAHTAAIKTDGTLWLWGGNSNGQLGDNTVTIRSSPVQTVAFGTNWKSVSACGFHTAAIKTDGTLWTWGRNNYGQLGDNTVTPRSSPVQTVAYGTNWKSVSGGGDHTACIKTDGTLWLWGRNTYGQLGDNTSGATTTNSKSSPVQTVAYGTNWKSVSCSSNSTFAVKDDS